MVQRSLSKKLETVSGTITGMDANGLIVDDRNRIDADVVVNCIGFQRNAVNAIKICEHTHMYFKS